MQFIPVDQSRLGEVVGLSVSADTDQEGTQKENRDGVPTWRIEVLIRPDQGKSSVEQIKVAHPSEPLVIPMTGLRFEGLTAISWQMGTRAGVSLRADAFEEA